MLISLSAQTGKPSHGAETPVPCHTSRFMHRAKQKPLSWVRELVPSIAGSIAARCWSLGGTSAKGHFTLALSLSAPSPGSCHPAVEMRAAGLDAPSAWPGTTTSKPPEIPASHRYLLCKYLHVFPINEAAQVTRVFDFPHLQRRSQSHYYQPTERTRYEPLKSR